MESGITLGIISYVSFVFSFLHFPEAIKRFLLKNPFLTDCLSVIISFFLLTGISKSIVAVIAAMLCGLLVNITLMVRNYFY
jgi:hypothetical protein